MPHTEALDPALILDDWINRVQNLPEEIRFLQDEIADKDRQYHECIRAIEERDGKIQKFIKANGSHTENPKEDTLRAQINEQYTKADHLAAEKLTLTQKLQLIMDKHLRHLDSQFKVLYDRAEPGFTDPDEVPSLLRQSAANHPPPSSRSANPAAHLIGGSMPATPLNPILNSSNPALARIPNPQVRHAQAQQTHAASAPATPAASMLLNRPVRESSAGPALKRGQRQNSGLGSVPVTSSGLARHSSLGPGTPKGSSVAGAGGTVRAGSAGPRTGPTKTTNPNGVRKGTPSSVTSRKAAGTTKGNSNKSNLSRIKNASDSRRNSPASTADSELSEAESGSGDEERQSRHGSGTPAAEGKNAHGDEEMEGDDEADDKKKYCLCQNVSFGDMVACDNDNCPYEWFHWSCVGLKSEPNGAWYCPVCSEKMKKKNSA